MSNVPYLWQQVSSRGCVGLRPPCQREICPTEVQPRPRLKEEERLSEVRGGLSATVATTLAHLCFISPQYTTKACFPQHIHSPLLRPSELVRTSPRSHGLIQTGRALTWSPAVCAHVIGRNLQDLFQRSGCSLIDRHVDFSAPIPGENRYFSFLWKK